MLHAEHAAAHMTVELLLRLIYNVLEYLPLIAFRHEPQTEREDIGRHRIIVVLRGGRVEELGIVSLFHLS